MALEQCSPDRKIERNHAVDLIKFIATFMVVALHLNVERASCGYEYCNIAIFAGIAIPLFFMVSGYLMAGKNGGVKYSLYKIKNIIVFTVTICLLYDVLVYFVKGTLVPSFPMCLFQGSVWWHFWYFGSMIILYALLPVTSKLIHSNKLPLYIIILGIISIVFWVLDLTVQFERKYICQTLRIWYFLFYFMLGAYISTHNVQRQIRWYVVLITMACYYLSVRMISAGGVEYNFGSPFCVLYTISVFCFFAGRQYTNNVIPFLSNLILPTYTFHVLILKKIVVNYISLAVETVLPIYQIAFVLELLISVVIILMISKLVSLLPFYKKVFRL